LHRHKVFSKLRIC